MKRQQQRKIVTVGEGYYAPPTLLMEEGTERRRRHTADATQLDSCVASAVCIGLIATTYLLLVLFLSTNLDPTHHILHKLLKLLDSKTLSLVIPSITTEPNLGLTL